MDRGRVQASSLRLLLLFLACGCHVRVASAAVAPPPPPSNRASGVRSAGVSTAREPSVWSCVLLSNRSLMPANHSVGPWWSRQNCSGRVGLVKIDGIVVNIVQAGLGGSLRMRAQPVVAQGAAGLAPLSALAAAAGGASVRPFVPLAGVNGGYFWRTDSKSFLDDVCWGKTRADALHNASATDPNAGVGDSVTIVDSRYVSSNCDKPGNSRPAVAILDEPARIEVLGRGARVAAGVKSAIGAGPNLVSYDNTTGESYIDVVGDNINILERASNTAVALRRQQQRHAGQEAAGQELMLITFDGHDGCTEYGNCGVNAHQLAAFLLDHLHVHSAMNMDQGGSTTMWVRGQPHNGIVTNPGAGERDIFNGLFIGY